MRTLSVFLALAVAGPALAVPAQVQHTGRLFDAAGLPLTGSHSVDAGLFVDPTGGSAVWSEVQSVDFDDGYFTILLGSNTVGNPIDDAVLDQASLFVGLTVDGTSLGGRQRVTSVPYAMRANTALNVSGGIVDASEIRIDGNTVIDNTGIVGGATLEGLSCGNQQIPLFDGGSWGCAAAASATTAWDDLTNVPGGFLDGTDDDSLGDLSCFDDQLARWSTADQRWGCSDDNTLDETAVDGFVANNGYALSADLASVATSGDYADLSNTPALFDGDYNSLSNLPGLADVATSGDYADLLNVPTFSTVATTGDYDDLVNPPSLAAVATSGQYSDLTGAPALSAVATSGDYTDLVNTPALAAVATSGQYGDLSGTPALSAVATSGQYGDLTGLPSLFDGAWTSLSGVPGGFSDGVDNTLTEAQVETFITNGPITLAAGSTVAGDSLGARGVTYEHWGRDDCPSGTNTVYTGFVGGGYYNSVGGISDYVCLHDSPVYGTFSDSNNNQGIIYSAEYEVFGNNGLPGLGSAPGDKTAQCALCEQPSADQTITVWGRDDCPTGWTEEYDGYMMAGHYQHNHDTAVICVDKALDTSEGAGNQNGALLYPVEAENDGTMGSYVNQRELTCAVCSK